MGEDYKNFIVKYKDKITNIPTIDDVAKFYLEKMQEINFNNTREVYDCLSDVRELNGDETNLEVSLSDIEKNLDTILVYPYSDGSFISFFNPNYDFHYRKDNQLKLWIDAKLENLPEIAVRLAEKIDSRSCKHISDKDAPVETSRFKISRDLHRNDALTIYTDYACVDQIIQDLIEMREEKPELFESESRPNPFVMKIDGFISYADIDHDSSFPKLLANIFREVNTHRDVILNQPSDKRMSFIKIYVLNAIIGDFYTEKETILANPQNIASSRTSDGILIKDLSQEDRDEYVATLNQLQSKLLEKPEPEMA